MDYLNWIVGHAFEIIVMLILAGSMIGLVSMTGNRHKGPFRQPGDPPRSGKPAQYGMP